MWVQRWHFVKPTRRVLRRCKRSLDRLAGREERKATWAARCAEAGQVDLPPRSVGVQTDSTGPPPRGDAAPGSSLVEAAVPSDAANPPGRCHGGVPAPGPVEPPPVEQPPPRDACAPPQPAPTTTTPRGEVRGGGAAGAESSAGSASGSASKPAPTTTTPRGEVRGGGAAGAESSAGSASGSASKPAPTTTTPRGEVPAAAKKAESRRKRRQAKKGGGMVQAAALPPATANRAAPRASSVLDRVPSSSVGEEELHRLNQSIQVQMSHQPGQATNNNIYKNKDIKLFQNCLMNHMENRVFHQFLKNR